ncbi:unnamed protein product [Prorocentrum cordatum]|nr:unnamed protein product [Polarella glacialis]
MVLGHLAAKGLLGTVQILDPDRRTCDLLVPEQTLARRPPGAAGEPAEQERGGCGCQGGCLGLAPVGLSAVDHQAEIAAAGAHASVTMRSFGGLTFPGSEDVQEVRLRAGAPIVNWWVHEVLGQPCVDVHLLKIDAEGSEFSVLRGLEPLLAEHRVRFLFLEFWPVALMTWGDDVHLRGLRRWLAHYGFLCRFLGTLWEPETFEEFVARHTTEAQMADFHMENMSFNDLLCEDLHWADPCGHERAAAAAGRELGFRAAEQQQHGHAGRPMRMWRHCRRAFRFFHDATGTTAHAVTTQFGVSHGTATKALYRRLLPVEADAVEGYVRRWLRDRGISPQCALDNLSRLPGTIPQRHRWALFQWLFNALSTAKRMRLRGDGGADACLLCGGGEDSISPTGRPGGQGRAGDGLIQSSFGAVRLRDGAAQGRVGRLLPSYSSNVAEYEGMLCCFRGALRWPDTAVTLQVGALLLACQCNMEWRCRSPSLVPYWEQAADLLRLRASGTTYSIRHIYREFNALADSIANGQDITSDWLLSNSWSILVEPSPGRTRPEPSSAGKGPLESPLAGSAEGGELPEQVAKEGAGVGRPPRGSAYSRLEARAARTEGQGKAGAPEPGPAGAAAAAAPLSPLLATVAMLKAMVGGGILALPCAFGRVGLALALPLLPIVAGLTALGTLRLIQCRLQAADDCGMGPLGVIALRVLGRPGLWVCATAALLTQFGIGEAAVRTLLFCTLCALCLVRGLGGLAWLSAVALMVYAYMLLALAKFGALAIREGASLTLGSALLPMRWWGLGGFLGTTISAFEGIVVGQYIFDEMQVDSVEPFKQVLVNSYLVATTLYAFAGAFGYLAYGDGVGEVFYQSFPQSSLDVRGCEVVLCIVLLITFVLQMYPVFRFLEGAVACASAPPLGQEGRRVPCQAAAQLALRWGVVLLTSLAAVAIPGVNTILAYVGGFCLSSIGLVLPGLIHIKLNGGDLTRLELGGDVLLISVGLVSFALTIVG